jgi:hypothetical protein
MASKIEGNPMAGWFCTRAKASASCVVLDGDVDGNDIHA